MAKKETTPEEPENVPVTSVTAPEMINKLGDMVKELTLQLTQQTLTVEKLTEAVTYWEHEYRKLKDGSN